MNIGVGIGIGIESDNYTTDITTDIIIAGGEVVYSQNLIISISSGGKEAILYVNTDTTFQPIY